MLNYFGFFLRYPVKRPLKDEERQRQLHQKQRLEVEESDDLSVIRFNSTYMELVDKWFSSRGMAVLVVVFGLVMGLAFVKTGVIKQFIKPIEGGWWLAIVTLIMILPVIGVSIWILKRDVFNLTYFPIRLNRKTRMVYAFRPNGTVLSVPWDEVFFCIGSLPQFGWEIQGHVLDKDGITVKETFAFPAYGAGDGDRDELLRYWEFVRRYMEDGPAPVYKCVEYCLPITDHKESFVEGFHRTHSWASGALLPLQVFVLLAYFVIYPGRWIAMRASKLPVWPQEIEAVCAIAPNDPFRKDASTNKPITDNTPIYFVAAVGAALLAAAWVWW